MGRTILCNLLSNTFGGTVYLVNPRRASVLGIKAYPTIAAVPVLVELAIVATAAHTVPGIMRKLHSRLETLQKAYGSGPLRGAAVDALSNPLSFWILW
ncbi:MAG: CoA-binding protein [Rubrobacter sp.]|nr:CoA-binding protein [Rubrobacter sp.]